MISTLLRSEQRLSKSQVFANIGTWDWNINTGELYWSERIAPLFGYPVGELETTYDNFLAALHPDDRDNVLNAVSQCIEKNSEYNIEHRVVWPDGQIRWVHERGDVVRDEKGRPSRMLGVITDIHEQKTLQLQKDQNQFLLNTLNKALTTFTTRQKFKKAADILLNGLLAATESEYGFIGEILFDKSNKPYLKTHAITNISWNDETRKLYKQWNEKGLEFTNVDTLFGHVITSGAPVLSNNPSTDKRSGGLPEGHPSMNNFLGIPVYYGRVLVGMYGLANRPAGYDEEIINHLKIFSTTYGTIIQAKRSLEKEEHSRIKLIRAKEQAETANKAKSSFLSSMSHELRTPLNAILGFAQLLRMENNLEQESLENIREIYQAGKHLLDLINEVLDLAKIESGYTTIDLEPVALHNVLTECEALLTPAAEEYNVSLNFPVNVYEDITILADYTRLKQVLCNLLSNAIKYNRNQGKVTISCQKKNQRVYISIKDDGPGIKKEDIPKLFIPFNRLGEEKSSTIEGTGIGLVITKQLIELMNGELSVHSSPGKGSEFSFYLPLAISAPPGTTKPTINKESIAPSTGKKVIYYIEDNLTNFRLVERFFSTLSQYEFHGANEPVAGLAAIEAIKPDIVLLDIDLPTMTGYEVIEKLRQNSELKGLIIFAVTAKAMESDIKKIMAYGFDECITKPIDFTEMKEKLSRALN